MPFPNHRCPQFGAQKWAMNEEVAIWPSTIPDRRVMSCMPAVPDGGESRTRHMLVVLAISGKRDRSHPHGGWKQEPKCGEYLRSKSHTASLSSLPFRNLTRDCKLNIRE